MLLDAYHVIARSRRHMVGASVIPMPITMQEINDYLEQLPPPIDKQDFIAAVFSLDEVVLKK